MTSKRSRSGKIIEANNGQRKKSMKARKYALIALAALSLVACSPSIYPIQLEMRHPSTSGLDLNRKTMAIAYMKGSGPADSLFSLTVASGLARTLEKDYFGGEEVIPIFQVPESASVSLELMLKYFLESDQDVLFLLAPPEISSVSLGNNRAVYGKIINSVDSAFTCQAHVPFQQKLYVFDSLEGVDTFHTFRGGSTIQLDVYNNGALTSQALKIEALRQAAYHADRVGLQLGNSFVSTWKLEQYSLYYFDDFSSQDWFKPLEEASQFQWIKAVNLWEPFLKLRDYQKRACASYNIAVAYYMLGDYELATKWLDQADRMSTLELSPGLRKRILERSRK